MSPSMAFCETPISTGRSRQAQPFESQDSLHSKRPQRVILDNDDPNMLTGERPSLFHLLRMRNSREARFVHSVLEGKGHQNVNKGYFAYNHDLPAAKIRTNNSGRGMRHLHGVGRAEDVIEGLVRCLGRASHFRVITYRVGKRGRK